MGGVGIAQLVTEPNELRSVSLLCMSLLMLGSSQFRFRGAFLRVAQFASKSCPAVEPTVENFGLRFRVVDL